MFLAWRGDLTYLNVTHHGTCYLPFFMKKAFRQLIKGLPLRTILLGCWEEMARIQWNWLTIVTLKRTRLAGLMPTVVLELESLGGGLCNSCFWKIKASTSHFCISASTSLRTSSDRSKALMQKHTQRDRTVILMLVMDHLRATKLRLVEGFWLQTIALAPTLMRIGDADSVWVTGLHSSSDKFWGWGLLVRPGGGAVSRSTEVELCMSA